jgi:Putative DNA-binding domain
MSPAATATTLAPTLAAQQQALLAALFVRPIESVAADAIKTVADHAYFTGARGLKAYQSNGLALADRTLRGAYPVMAQLLGDESFTLLAHDFWRRHPPVRGDLTQWGGELAGFVQCNAQLVEEPYLGDVCRVEWALHQAAGAADREPDLSTFTLLSTNEPDALTLVLSSGVAVISSVYPVASIVTAHLNHSPAFDEVGRRLREGVFESALVWRQGFRPQVAACSPAQATFVAAVQSGASLLLALTGAGDFSFNDWLTAAVQSGLVLGARPIQAHTTA